MQFVIWYLTWILVRKASAPCNCGYCCPSGAELCGCSENLVSVKFGKSQPPEEMQWFVKYIPLKQLPFWGVINTVYHIPDPLLLSPKALTHLGERERCRTYNECIRKISRRPWHSVQRYIWECLPGNRGKGFLWRSETLCLALLGDTVFIFTSVIVPGLNISCLKPYTS